MTAVAVLAVGVGVALAVAVGVAVDVGVLLGVVVLDAVVLAVGVAWPASRAPTALDDALALELADASGVGVGERR